MYFIPISPPTFLQRFRFSNPYTLRRTLHSVYEVPSRMELSTGQFCRQGKILFSQEMGFHHAIALR